MFWPGLFTSPVIKQVGSTDVIQFLTHLPFERYYKCMRVKASIGDYLACFEKLRIIIILLKN